MALSRVPGLDELYVGSMFVLRRPSTLQDYGITHILSAINYSLDQNDELRGQYAHMSIDVDDVEDADILVHLSRCVRFIEHALYPGQDNFDSSARLQRLAARSPNRDDVVEPAPRGAAATDLETSSSVKQGVAGQDRKGAVLVHCAMGKSRSVTVAIAYLLWKYPHRFGATEAANPNKADAANHAVVRAWELVRSARGIAEPNPGFIKQLELWWLMGCPTNTDDAVEKHVVYQRWIYKRQVEESARIGRAPDWLRFEDEEEPDQQQGGIVTAPNAASTVTRVPQNKELRCKKCRKVLATAPFIVPHVPLTQSKEPCPHYFVEPLSWMRSTLEEGNLEGRLACPNSKCGSSIGRYSWRGFKCACREWVCPAFSLQRARVDEATVAASVTDVRAAFGIRMPPSAIARQQNL